MAAADPYFTADEFRAVYDDAEVAALEDELIESHRATAEEIIEGLDTEDGCHQAFVVREETFELSGSPRMQVPRYRVRSIEAVSFDGEEQGVDGLWLDTGNIFGGRWRGPVTVTVTHGWDSPPRRIKEAAILLTYHRAIKGPIDDRATGRVTPEGSVLTIATPGLRGAITGIPEVDSAIAQYRKPRIRPTSVWAGEPDDTSPGISSWRAGTWP